MKIINLLILAIVLVLVVTISSRSFGKSKSHKKDPIPLEKFLKSGNVDPDKVKSFTKMAEAAGESCKNDCTIHTATYFLRKGDSFICRCLTSWKKSKHGDIWKEMPDDLKNNIINKIDDDGFAILIN